ncbi:phytanoyl-CoA dioxygenase family protein [Aspergillus fijiensis CBS 313.89]|uniref:Phytanoyl-CoA dioxygenase family protein n=1 Tax=Aspergillus fijiensis CBS 313.89 TaxID=1448319 RepID=A0A8G1RT05_9EURO|nr:uncharacterized protein BO72DRAFT_477052 [Aspergillus fijiensis CBS 313.89]RAK77753.1 hypothetical protein BO72DRAFT_477052 [Aspergillus fijiensis CBS 313.89]
MTSRLSQIDFEMFRNTQRSSGNFYFPIIQRLPYSAPREDFIDALKRDGCVIVQGFTTLETLEEARQEVQPWLEKEEQRSKLGALNGGTRTCTRLIGRSKTVREKFFSDQLYQDLAEEFLAITTTSWYGDEPSTNTTQPLLSIAITMEIRPGANAQKLHRDDKNHHARHARVDAYHANRDMLLGLFVPGCDTRRANGATRVVPGSHLWGDEMPDFGPNGETGLVDAALQAGEAMIMLGSLYHGGGEFFESSGGRMMHIMFMCSGIYRQEEISYLSYPIEDVRTYSKLVQQRLGWKQSEPNLGWVDLISPDALL